MTGIIPPKLVDKLEFRMMTGQIEANISSTILLDGCKFLRVPNVHAICLWEPEQESVAFGMWLATESGILKGLDVAKQQPHSHFFFFLPLFIY